MNVDITKELPTVLSLCSGYGGIERGLDLAGFEHRTITYVEIEAFAIANLVNKMENGKLDVAPIWSNLKTLPVQPFRDKVDLITGGYPCQPFSGAGKRLGEEDPRHLWPYIRRHIESIRPVQCFFENVEGHISLGLREVISDMENLGFKVAWGIFSAREVGAPHQRKRVYILGNSKHYGSSTATERRGNIKNGIWSAQRKGETVQSQRASQPKCGSNLSEVNTLAYTDSSGLRQSNKENQNKPSEQPDSSSFQCSGYMAHPSSKRLQRGEQLRFDTEKTSERRKSAYGSVAKRGNDVEPGQWPPESNICRVVDGCADRVDRIRLLGNGVVPQTAAKAWVTLNSKLNSGEIINE